MKKLISNESSKIPFANGDLTFGNRIVIVILAFGTFVLAAIKGEAEHLAKLGNHTLMGIVIRRA